MWLASESDFAHSIADTVELVARGDIAAFEVAGHTDIGAVGQARFTQAIVALAGAAKAHRRKVVLRWRCDPVGSEDASRRTAANISKLLVAIKAAAAHLAQTGEHLQSWVELEITNVGALSATLAGELKQYGVVTPDLLEPASDSTILYVWDTSDPAQAWLGEYRLTAEGSTLIRHQSVLADEVATQQIELQRLGKRQGATVGGFVIWAFDETGEVWTQQACLASGPRDAWRLGKIQIASTSVAAVSSFYDHDDYGHRGVKLQLCSGEQLVVAEEFDPAAKHDPTYNQDNLAVDGAWTSYLAEALADWLNPDIALGLDWPASSDGEAPNGKSGLNCCG